MNRALKALTAAIAAASILTACSPSESGTTTPPASVTTAAQGAPTVTEPFTQPSTQPSATEPAATMPSTTTASTQAAATTAAASPQGTDGKVAEIMNRSSSAMEDLENYRITSESAMDMMGQQITTISTIDMYPGTESMKMTSEISGMTMETYVVEDMIYVQMPGAGWMKMPAGSGENGEVEVTPMTGEEYARYFVSEETPEGYRIRTIRPIPLEELQRIGNIYQEESQVPGEEEIPQLNATVELDMLIDENYYTVENNMTMIMETEEGELETVTKTTMSHFNELEPFELPDEAQEAEELEVPAAPGNP